MKAKPKRTVSCGSGDIRIMKCSFHPEVDSSQICSACKKYLCDDCANRIKEKVYCAECLEKGAEWVATVKDFRLPSDSPRRAAIFAIIPGIGAVYNNEYLKAVTYFTVFAALIMMGDALNAVFGFGAFVFLVFTMFDAYRTAEKRARRIAQPDGSALEPGYTDNSLTGWGVFLILAGQYESWSLPFSILLGTPFAVFGAFSGNNLQVISPKVVSKMA